MGPFFRSPRFERRTPPLLIADRCAAIAGSTALGLAPRPWSCQAASSSHVPYGLPVGNLATAPGWRSALCHATHPGEWLAVGRTPSPRTPFWHLASGQGCRLAHVIHFTTDQQNTTLLAGRPRYGQLGRPGNLTASMMTDPRRTLSFLPRLITPMQRRRKPLQHAH